MVITTTSRSSDVTTLNETTHRMMTSDATGSNATGSRGRGCGSYNATHKATAECDYCGGPYHTNEDDPSVLPTTPSVTNAELLDTTLISAEAAHPQRVWKTPTEDVATAIA